MLIVPPATAVKQKKWSLIALDLIVKLLQPMISTSTNGNYYSSSPNGG